MMYGPLGELAWPVLGILVAFLVWLALREVTCWYLKLNKLLATLESINQGLALVLDSLKRVESHLPPTEDKPTPEV